MNQLDQLSQSVPYSQGHPKGEFNGIIKDIIQKSSQTGTPYWEILGQTKHGDTPKLLLWGATDQDVMTAKIAAEQGSTMKLDGIKRNIQMLRALLIKVGCMDEDQVNVMSFTQMINSLASLIGKPAKIRITAGIRKDGKGYTSVFYDAPISQTITEGAVQSHQAQPMQQVQQSMQQTQPMTSGQTTQQRNQLPERPQGGYNQSPFDMPLPASQIPF